jgi:hypothetical protein
MCVYITGLKTNLLLKNILINHCYCDLTKAKRKVNFFFIILKIMTSQQQKQEFIYFETFYKTYRETFKKPADSLFLFIHWFMLKNSYQSTFNNIVS